MSTFNRIRQYMDETPGPYNRKKISMDMGIPISTVGDVLNVMCRRGELYKADKSIHEGRVYQTYSREGLEVCTCLLAKQLGYRIPR